MNFFLGNLRVNFVGGFHTPWKDKNIFKKPRKENFYNNKENKINEKNSIPNNNFFISKDTDLRRTEKINRGGKKSKKRGLSDNKNKKDPFDIDYKNYDENNEINQNNINFFDSFPQNNDVNLKKKELEMNSYLKSIKSGIKISQNHPIYYKPNVEIKKEGVIDINSYFEDSDHSPSPIKNYYNQPNSKPNSNMNINKTGILSNKNSDKIFFNNSNKQQSDYSELFK
jgi:hypothetical protein